jgi:cytochrome oxidase assembly protein ShyY1
MEWTQELPGLQVGCSLIFRIASLYPGTFQILRDKEVQGAVRMKEPRSPVLAGPDAGGGLVPAKRSKRWATSSGCSTTFVAWEMTPGPRILPAGSTGSCQRGHSCS